MTTHFVTPKFPSWLNAAVFAVVLGELIYYGISTAVPAIWAILIFALFYFGYMTFIRHDSLGLIFALLFFTAYHSLLLNLNREMPIAGLFLIIFLVNSAIMWLLLHYATHLKQEYHFAYSLISGFLIAQIITLFAAMSRDWPFRLELASYVPTVFSYVFWRLACLSAEAMLGWKQFMQLVALIIILIIVMILASPNVQV